MKTIIQAALGLALLGVTTLETRAGGSSYIPGTMGNCTGCWGLLGRVFHHPCLGGIGHHHPYSGGAPMQLTPWYLTFPHDGYFQNPAPPAYPYWPTQGRTPPGHGAMMPGTVVPGQGSAPFYWSTR